MMPGGASPRGNRVVAHMRAHEHAYNLLAAIVLGLAERDEIHGGGTCRRLADTIADIDATTEWFTSRLVHGLSAAEIVRRRVAAEAPGWTREEWRLAYRDARIEVAQVGDEAYQGDPDALRCARRAPHTFGAPVAVFYVSRRRQWPRRRGSYQGGFATYADPRRRLDCRRAGVSLPMEIAGPIGRLP